MKTLSVNNSNDIFIGSSGGLSTSSDLEAVLQACAHAAKTQLGELMYATDTGVPNFASVWNGSPNLQQFEAALRVVIIAVENVTGIDSLEVTRQSDKLMYSITIKTVYGTGVVNG